MTDLSADASLRILGEGKTEKWTIDTAAGATYYKGQPMMLLLNAGDTLNVAGWVGKQDIKATEVCVGIAAETKTVVTGDPETTEIEIYVAPSIIGFKSTVFTNADLGKAVYMEDSAILENAAGAAGVSRSSA